jgi:nucleoside-diphosphate-sugar epimerase
MAKILVTGGAGYIGSILVPELLKDLHYVTVLDNFMYNQSSLLDVCSNSKLTVIRGDVRDTDRLSRILSFTQFDFVIPLAALVGMPACDKDPIIAESINFGGVKNITDLLNKISPSTKIIFPNTNSGYGIGEKDAFCTETSPLNPISLYGKVKCMAEESVMDYKNSIVLRLATVFGASPRMRLDLLVNDFVYRACTDKFVVLFESSFKRNYIHIKDVVRAFIYCIHNFERMKNNVYNLGLSDCNISKLELCKTIKFYIPDFYFTESEFNKDPDQRNYIVSNEKIEKAGFTPAYSLDFGIQELIKAFQIIRRNQYSNV